MDWFARTSSISDERYHRRQAANRHDAFGAHIKHVPSTVADGQGFANRKTAALFLEVIP